MITRIVIINSIISSSPPSFSLILIIIMKVSNPLRTRADYDAAQEGIVREVGTFCRCKHPSLVRYVPFHHICEAAFCTWYIICICTWWFWGYFPTFSGTTGWWPTSRGWTFGWSPSLWPATVLPSCCNSPTWRRSTRFGGKSVWGCLPALLQPWTTFITGTEHGIKISKLIVVLERFSYWYIHSLLS